MVVWFIFLQLFVFLFQILVLFGLLVGCVEGGMVSDVNIVGGR